MTHANLEVAPNKGKQSIAQPADDAALGLRKLIGAYDRLLDQYMPPSILVDENWMVIDTFAGAGRYLRLRSRRPTQSILELSCEPIRSALRSAIDRLGNGEHPVEMGPITVYNDAGDEEHLSMIVSAVPLEDEHGVCYSIVLEPEKPTSLYRYDSSSCSVRETVDADHVAHSTSSLGTGAAHGNFFGGDEFDQLMDAGQMAGILLDCDLRIRSFTSHAARIFHLVEHDIGREIRTFLSVLEVADLVDRIRAVVKTGDSDEVEVHRHPIGQYLVARIAPFFKGGEIEGAILTVIDLSQLETRKQEIRMLSSIVQSSDDAIVSRDRDNRIVTWNAAAEELFGYSAKEAIGQDISLIVPPGQESDYDQTLRLMQKGGHLDHFDSLRLTKCGQTIKVSVRLSPVYDDDHRLIGMSSIERDISLQSEFLEKLTASERKFQDFYHHSPDMYCSVEANTDAIVDCNDRMCQRLNLNRSEIIGRPVLDLHSLSTREEARHSIDQFKASGEVIDQELELVRRDGTTIPVSLNMSAVRDETGKIIGSRSVWRDMSSAKKKQEQVRQSELRYRNSFQNSAIGIAQVDLHGRYLMTNRRICEIVGYSQEELSELRFSDITHHDDLPDELALHEELISGRAESYKIEKRYIHKLGHEVWASLFVSLERDAEGKPQSCHAYIEDISSRKELESELRLAISQRDQFLAMLSHELRNPLGAILNTCAVLHRGRGLPKTMQQPVSIVTRQARQMAELLDDLLDVSRITTGKIKLEKSPVILSEIVDEAFESQQGLAAARQQRLLVTYSDEPLPIFGDRSRLVQVVVNLLNNAIKYSGEGGVIKVTLEKKGRNAVIRVKDSGVGIEPELIESLFEMFAQKDSTLDRSGGGMGLGLHLVRKLVEFHSGRVFGRSEGVGKGSEFVVELPLSNRVRSALTAKSRLKSNSPAMPPIEKIVVVEDIADARNMLVALLEADDYEVSAAADGEAGLNLILREKPDLAIVDIGLPKMDGYEVARRVREQLSKSEVTLIALSGYGQDSDQDRALAAGFDMHMVKPLNTARLEKILSR